MSHPDSVSLFNSSIQQKEPQQEKYIEKCPCKIAQSGGVGFFLYGISSSGVLS